jgi:hypothetical protein
MSVCNARSWLDFVARADQMKRAQILIGPPLNDICLRRLTSFRKTSKEFRRNTSTSPSQK